MLSVLTCNIGSSSVKLSLYEWKTLTPLRSQTLEIKASSLLGMELKEFFAGGFFADTILQAIGCRVVHGGATFRDPTVVDEKVLEAIRSFAFLAPIHNPKAAEFIEACQRVRPTIPIVAVFDTAFHRTLPAVATTYALPQNLVAKSGLTRYGFHGIAHQQVSERLRAAQGQNISTDRLITCHLGSGASVCAIYKGKSIDTSMGYTPMEGLIMSTRCGDVDPGIIFSLLQDTSLSEEQLHSLLNDESGLKGISGISGDMRELELAAERGNEKAEHALQCFTYRIVKYIGAYVAVLGGLDAIVFSGGIGENSSIIRSRVCAALRYLGVALDEAANHVASGSALDCISKKSVQPSVWVIHADEALQIAKETRAVINYS
jgi:acetate kinase